MKTDKQTLLEQGRELVAAVYKQSDRAMFAFQTWAKPNATEEAALRVLVKKWQSFVVEAEAAGINVRQEFAKDCKFLAGEVKMLTPPPARMDLRLHLFLNDRVNANLSRPATKKSSMGDGLDWMLQ